LTSRLAVTDLSKKYNGYTILAPVSFALYPGEITVLSGQNGSGKTTLLSCIAGLLRPSSGSVTVDGFDLYRDEVEVRRRLYLVPDVPKFFLELTAWEHLRFIAMANNDIQDFDSRAELLLQKLGLWAVKDQFPHHYSRGMRLRLGLALALIRPLEVLLLDEPTSALDSYGVGVLINELQALRTRGATILLSTHDPGLIDQLADRHFTLTQGVLEVH
jgi:ABC-2 type transport system ATP-binding protein